MLRTSLVIAVVALFTGVLSGAPLCSDVTGTGSGGSLTMEDLVGLGSGGCEIGDKLFSDFAYTAFVIQGSGVVPGAGSVFITPLPTPSSDPGLEFQSVWSAGVGSIIDVSIKFNVATVSGAPLIKDASLGVYGLSGGTLGGSETLCLGVTWQTGCGSPVTIPTPTNGGTNSVDWLSNPPGPVNLVGVIKDISLTNTGTGAAEFSIIQERFSQVPEPATLFLMGGGLVALGLSRKWQTRKRG